MNQYVPDENDLDWLAGRTSEPVDLNDQERMKWRRAQVAKNPPRADYSWAIGIILMIAFMLLAIALAGNSWNPATGNSPESGPEGCISGNASGAGC